MFSDTKPGVPGADIETLGFREVIAISGGWGVRALATSERARSKATSRAIDAGKVSGDPRSGTGYSSWAGGFQKGHSHIPRRGWSAAAAKLARHHKEGFT